MICSEGSSVFAYDISGSTRDSDPDIGAYELATAVGYTHAIMGVAAGSLGKILDIAKASVSKVLDT